MVECDLPKVEIAGSSPVFRSIIGIIMNIEELKNKIIELNDKIKSTDINNLEDLNNFKTFFNLELNKILQIFKTLDISIKKELGKQINELKNNIDSKYKLSVDFLKNNNKKQDNNIDLSLPVNVNLGNRHPLTNLEKKFIEIFKKIGFDIVDTPEIEDDWHNFSALNIPKDHPAREMQDTFFIKDFKDLVLRTHTSTSQIRILEKYKPPIKCISTGRVYRNETISSRSHCYFHQIDGFYVDKGVCMLDMIYIFKSFVKLLFGPKTDIRVRPSYFPFTSPSVEIDVQCFICNSKGCPICKNSGYLEIFGGGVIHRNVLKNCNIDTNIYSGIAFGGGIERTSLQIHRIKDIRMYSLNDINFLKQFEFNNI